MDHHRSFDPIKFGQFILWLALGVIILIGGFLWWLVFTWEEPEEIVPVVERPETETTLPEEAMYRCEPGEKCS